MFYYAARFVMWVGLRLLYRVRPSGVENIPSEGAFVLCANHVHSLDPAMLAICMKRRVYFMAKKELFEKFFFRQFFTRLGAFPVDRGMSDTKSYKKAIGILNEGSGLLVFSQGTRTTDFSHAKSGAALFALKTGAPIIPAGISGRYKFFRKIRISYGKPVSMEPYKDKKIKTELVNEVMSEVMAAVVECCKDYEP